MVFSFRGFGNGKESFWEEHCCLPHGTVEGPARGACAGSMLTKVLNSLDGCLGGVQWEDLDWKRMHISARERKKGKHQARQVLHIFAPRVTHHMLICTCTTISTLAKQHPPATLAVDFIFHATLPKAQMSSTGVLMCSQFSSLSSINTAPKR